MFSEIFAISGKIKKKQCSAKFHDDSQESNLYSILNSKKIPASVINTLLDNRDIQKWTKYVCHHCILVCQSADNPQPFPNPSPATETKETYPLHPATETEETSPPTNENLSLSFVIRRTSVRLNHSQIIGQVNG